MGIDARTPIPTTAGWQLARFIKPGDEVFDYTGLPVKVVSVQEYTTVVCHKIWTKDGLTLVVDSRTGIPVYDSKAFLTLSKWGRKVPTREEYSLPIYAPQNLATIDTGWCRMPTCYPIKPTAKPLPLHPYDMGCVDRRQEQGQAHTGHIQADRELRQDPRPHSRRLFVLVV